jgi:hypothetical protein
MVDLCKRNLILASASALALASGSPSDKELAAL